MKNIKVGDVVRVAVEGCGRDDVFSYAVILEEVDDKYFFITKNGLGIWQTESEILAAKNEGPKVTIWLEMFQFGKETKDALPFFVRHFLLKNRKFPTDSVFSVEAEFMIRNNCVLHTIHATR